MSVVRPIRQKDGCKGRYEIDPPRRGMLVVWAGMCLSGGGALWLVIRLIGDARSAEETAQTLSADQLKSLLVLLICTSFGMVALAFSAAIQRARLRNIDVQAKRLEHFSGMGSDVHAVAVYRDRVEADALMKVQFEKETWERERDAWKAEETARIYQQVLSQVDRGVLGCTRCQRELWRNAG